MNQPPEILEPSCEEEPQLDTEDTTIHLYAIADRKWTCERAMRLQGSIAGISIMVFIDAGADRNFLNPKIATQLQAAIDATKTQKKIVVTTGQS